MMDRDDYWQAGKVKIKKLPTQQELRDRFLYCSEDGMLVHKTNRQIAARWCHQGTRSSYVVDLNWHKGRFKHSRLVYAWHYGDPAEYQIDHVDGNRRNDRIENLRKATASTNNMNKPTKGYCRMIRNGRELWQVDVMLNGKHHYGGRYRAEQQAKIAAIALKQKLHGDFANFKALTKIRRPSLQLSFGF